MQVLYLNYNSEKSGKDYSVTSEQYDITDYVTELNWSGSKDEVARKVELTLLNAPTDPNIEGIYLKLGAMVYLFDDEDNEYEDFSYSDYADMALESLENGETPPPTHNPVENLVEP